MWGFFALAALKSFANLAHAEDVRQSSRYSLYNLSVLLPLPKEKIEDSWGLDARGCGQPLLSQELFAQVPMLVRVPYKIEQQYHDVRLVAVRFDPIQGETRLVFQPLIWEEWGIDQKGFWAEDAAVHLFFKTSKETIVKWQNLMRTKFGSPTPLLLGVHPHFRRGGDMRDLDFVLCHLAEVAPFKLTFMNVRGRRVLWAFGGFSIDRVDGQLVRGKDVDIPNAENIFVDSQDAKMSVQRIAKFAGTLRAGLLPKPNRGDHLMATFNAGPNNEIPYPAGVRATVDRIENPALNTPKTVDCVSCHATEFTRIWLERRYNTKPSDQEYPLTKAYSIDTSVSTVARQNSAGFRSFGYLDREAVVSRRVLNESIQVQHFLAR